MSSSERARAQSGKSVVALEPEHYVSLSWLIQETEVHAMSVQARSHTELKAANMDFRVRGNDGGTGVPLSQ